MSCELNQSHVCAVHVFWMYAYATTCLIKSYLFFSYCTCLTRCTIRPRVETKATENPVRPCFVCAFWLFDAGSVSGCRVSKSASTWPNMACSSPRLDWSPLRDATEEPFSSRLGETHFLVVLMVRLLILPEKHKQTKEKKKSQYYSFYLTAQKSHYCKLRRI